MDMQATTEGEALQADANDHDQGDFDNECLVDHCLLDDPAVQQLVGGDSGDPSGIVDPRAEFVRQLGELAREYDHILVISTYFDDYTHGALIRIGDDLTWADAPS